MYRIEKIHSKISLVRLATKSSSLFSLCTYVPLVDGFCIDTGFANARNSFWQALEEYGAKEKIKAILNTHAHEDHSGNNNFLAKKLKIPIYAPILSIPILQEKQRISKLRRFTWGTASTCSPIPLENIVRSAHHEFHVIPVPGHSEDLVCFYEEKEGWVFGGDLFISVKMQLGTPWENLQDWQASLEKVIALKPKLFFCYHKGAIYEPMPLLQAKRNLMKIFIEQVNTLSEQGREVTEIVRILWKKEKKIARWLSENDFSREHMVRAALRKPGVYS